MPYIENHRRDAILMQDAQPETAGELNFAITIRLLHFVGKKGLSYQTLNDIVGALESAKAEFQRLVVAPYEDSKSKQNGSLPWPKIH